MGDVGKSVLLNTIEKFLRFFFALSALKFFLCTQCINSSFPYDFSIFYFSTRVKTMFTAEPTARPESFLRVWKGDGKRVWNNVFQDDIVNENFQKIFDTMMEKFTFPSCRTEK